MRNLFAAVSFAWEQVKNYRFGAALFLVVGIMVLAHSFALHGRLRVCYEIEVDQAGSTKAYWSNDGVFSELQSVGTRVSSGINQHICLQHPSFRNIGTIRIDPIDHEAKFELHRIYLERVDLMFPWQMLERRSISLSTVTEAHDAEIVVDGPRRQFVAFSNDPYLVWKVDEEPLRFRWVFILNVITIMSLLVVGLALFAALPRGRVNNNQDVLYRGLVVFLIYPLYFAVAWVIVNYMDLFRYSQIIIFASLVLLFSYYLGTLNNLLVKESPAYLVIFSAIALIIALDLSVRMGRSDSALFKKPLHEPYHWKTTRKAEDNLNRSSVRYEEDFRRLRGILVPASRFLADIPTSYYAAAAMDLYPVVANRHHLHWAHIYLRTIDLLCSNSDPDRFVRHLKVQAKQLELLQLPRAKYLIIVRDADNPHIRNSCVNREHERVVANLEATFPMVFEGDFVRAYELLY